MVGVRRFDLITEYVTRKSDKKTDLQNLALIIFYPFFAYQVRYENVTEISIWRIFYHSFVSVIDVSWFKEWNYFFDCNMLKFGDNRISIKTLATWLLQLQVKPKLKDQTILRIFPNRIPGWLYFVEVCLFWEGHTLTNNHSWFKFY